MTIRWHSGRILFALARYLDWFHNRMMTEFEIDGFREDLVMVSRAGYASVYEIKISRADWQSFKEKARFNLGAARGDPGKHISRFYYVVPEDLYRECGIPDFVPEWVGVLTVRAGGPGDYLGYDVTREQRAARRFKAERLTDQTLQRIYEACYHRYWNQQTALLRERLFDRPAMRDQRGRVLGAA